MRTPTSKLRERGIDTFWAATWRDKAQGHLRDASDAANRAEYHFELAARELLEGGKWAERLASDYLDLAFRTLDWARWLRKQAKADALMAVRGRPLDSWVGRQKGAPRRFLTLDA
jgi:hypothetical protein